MKVLYIVSIWHYVVGMFTLTDLRVLVDMPYGLQRLTGCIFYKKIVMPNATK